MSAEINKVLLWICDHIASAGPKVIRARTPSVPPVLVFSDGACEVECTSIGAVLIDPLGICECFGAVMNEATIASWRSSEAQSQVIGQAELFPLLVARLTWQQHLEGRRVIFFIDNESARLALVKAYSPVLASLNIVLQCASFDAKHEISSWYARVPTLSNIADAPSRMCVSKELKALGAVVVPPVCPSGACLDGFLE